MAKKQRALALGIAMMMLVAACGSDGQIAESTGETDDSAPPGEGSGLDGGASGKGAGVVEVSANRLTVNHGCGFGFAKGSENQDLGLIVTFTGPYTAEGPDISVPIEWPSEEWIGEVQTGSDLFSDWCNDAIEENSPVPAMLETWKIVEGTLTLEVADEPADASHVFGEFTDLVVVSPAGERIELGAVPVSNELWGFFAG